jgi:hypothetical protein
MYSGVPKMAPVRVSGSLELGCPMMRARPKSSTFTNSELPSRRSSITLPGFRSRCTTSAACAAASASAI